MVADEDRGCLLGVTFVGPGVEELIHSATIAVAGQVPVSPLWHAVPCFPSISEVCQNPLAFICGPTSFVEAVAENLIRLGYPPEHVKTERFGGT